MRTDSSFVLVFELMNSGLEFAEDTRSCADLRVYVFGLLRHIVRDIWKLVGCIVFHITLIRPYSLILVYIV